MPGRSVGTAPYRSRLSQEDPVALNGRLADRLSRSASPTTRNRNPGYLRNAAAAFRTGIRRCRPMSRCRPSRRRSITGGPATAAAITPTSRISSARKISFRQKCFRARRSGCAATTAIARSSCMWNRSTYTSRSTCPSPISPCTTRKPAPTTSRSGRRIRTPRSRRPISPRRVRRNSTSSAHSTPAR